MVAALGLNDPKAAASRYVPTATQHEVRNAYRASGWFSKIVDIPADDSVREWREWKAKKADIELLEAEEKRLGIRVKLREAMIAARRDGGAAILIGGLPGASNEPLRLDSVRKGQIAFVTVLANDEIVGSEPDRDPMSPNYGKWSRYRITNGGTTLQEFHPSRVILIQGHSPNRDNPWGDSEFVRLRDSVSHSDAAAAVLMAMMLEAKVDVLSVKDMMANLANPEYEHLMMRRFQLANTFKSVNNALLIDSDDEWSQKQISFATLPDVMRVFLHMMAGVSDIPVTRLIGTAASGLNATGDNDIRQYYDMIKARQELVIAPQIAQLDEILIRSALGRRPPEVWYEWRSLWQQSDKERSENEKRDAETAAIYAQSGLLPIDALAKGVQNKIVDDGVYPGMEEALAESALELELPPDESDVTDPPPDEDEPPVTDRNRFADLLPRTLYVRRDVVNRADIERWARAQGITGLRDDLHVTVIYSRSYVDWAKAGDDWTNSDAQLTVNPGGPRMIERFGPAGEQVTVLEFTSSALAWRNESIRLRTGAEVDYEDYRPHITLSDDPAPEGIEPYRGKIVFGPEVFEPVKV